MVAWPPWSRFHLEEVLPEFVMWSENPADTWLQLPRSFDGELPAPGPGGLWPQADECCSKASWVAVEISAAGNVALPRGWKMFARACGLGRRCTLHFKYDGTATLFVRVFGEDGRRAGCCPEDNDDGGKVLRLGDGRDEHEGDLALGGGRGSPATTAPPLAEAPTAVATTNRHAVGLASRTVAGHPVLAPR